MPGNSPASKAPRQKRAKYSQCALGTKLVSEERKPQLIRMRMIQRRAPKRCMQRLLGTSNRI